MTVFVALLRAVNVGGTGKLRMGDLLALCKRIGLLDVRTYLQSGNAVFRSKRDLASTQALLSEALGKRMKKPVTLVLRTGPEMRGLLKTNPFPQAEPSRVIVFFYDRPPTRQAVAALAIPGNEQVRLVGREIFVHYPDGQGRSRLKLPFADACTGRNLNTLSKLAEMAEESG